MTKKIRLVISITLLTILLGILIMMIWNIYEEKKIQNRSESLKENIQVSKTNTTVENTKISTKEMLLQNAKHPLENEVAKEWKGYDVIAKLEIPTIQLETYILKNYSEQALQVSVVKFWGTEPNEIGNFCVVGHNFQNNNMFKNLYKLKIGDTLFISDNENGKIEYKVNDIYTVFPEQTKCLSQKTNGKIETTLITCTKDSKERIIVKASPEEGYKQK